MKSPTRIYYISDKAYNRLITMAQIGRYVPYGSERVKGLSKFLNDLADIALTDTRPALVKERHDIEISNHRAPTWLHSRQRRARQLQLTEHAVEVFFKRAFQHGIITLEPSAVGGPARQTPYPAVSFVLEGIGLEWLTPERLPTKS